MLLVAIILLLLYFYQDRVLELYQQFTKNYDEEADLDSASPFEALSGSLVFQRLNQVLELSNRYQKYNSLIYYEFLTKVRKFKKIIQKIMERPYLKERYIDDLHFLKIDIPNYFHSLVHNIPPSELPLFDTILFDLTTVMDELSSTVDSKNNKMGPLPVDRSFSPHYDFIIN